MEMATLNVSKQQAREAVFHYRHAVKLHRKAEDKAILRGYNQILKGRKLIELSKVIAAGGRDEQFRPRLAVMRADQRLCRMSAQRDGSIVFSDRLYINGNSPRDLVIQFPAGTLPAWNGGSWMVDAQSIVPSIPPQHRPADAISNYHILWEADWKRVPTDPALLKHLGGDLWAVLAVWDLTDLERAVLAGRR